MKVFVTVRIERPVAATVDTMKDTVGSLVKDQTVDTTKYAVGSLMKDQTADTTKDTLGSQVKEWIIANHKTAAI